MKWGSFEVGGEPSYGLFAEQGVIDVGRRVGDRHPTLGAALRAGVLAELGREFAAEAPDHRLEDIRYLPVLTDARRIFCIGLNYRAHQQETGRDPTDKPTVFMRFNESQTGHGRPLIKPLESDRFDWEGEIAVIMGRAGRRISRADALEHVAGYAPFNDGSVRDFQRHTTQFTPGKNFEASGAFGPWMMTPDEVGDIDQMEITTRLNGEVMQNAKAELLIFGFAELIEYISTFTTLLPSDVIVSGTPSPGGVGAARNPPLFMQPGDRIEVEVKPIGTLANVVAEG